MNYEQLISPRQLKELLSRYNLAWRKQWGQNFLIDRNIVQKILDEVEAAPRDHILEIGPGPGVLTLPMLETGADVTAVEIDRGLMQILKDMVGEAPGFHPVQADVQKVDLAQLCKWQGGEPRTIKVVANLPYYITSPLMYRLLDRELPWEKAVLMMQKEVAHRLTAPPSTPEYGALSVLVATCAVVQNTFPVSRNVFYPAPGVDSTVVSLLPRKEGNLLNDPGLFKQIVKEAFKQRRKTIVNTLPSLLSCNKEEFKNMLEAVQISPGSRAEELSAEEFAKLSELIYNKRQKNSTSAP